MLTTWKRLRYKTFRLANTSLPWVFIRFISKNHEYTEYRMYYCKIIKGSYIVWRGKVWLLRKKKPKKRERSHNDYSLSRLFIPRGLMVLALWMRGALTRSLIHKDKNYLNWDRKAAMLVAPTTFTSWITWWFSFRSPRPVSLSILFLYFRV